MTWPLSKRTIDSWKRIMERFSGEIQRLSYCCEFYEKAQKKVAGSVPN